MARKIKNPAMENNERVKILYTHFMKPVSCRGLLRKKKQGTDLTSVMTYSCIYFHGSLDAYDISNEYYFV